MLEHVALGKIRFCLTIDNKRTEKKSSIISEKSIKNMSNYDCNLNKRKKHTFNHFTKKVQNTTLIDQCIFHVFFNAAHHWLVDSLNAGLPVMKGECVCVCV